MKILVCVKQVVTAPKYVQFTADGLGIDAAFVTRELNEADTHAIEAAMQIRDANAGVEVVAATTGPGGSDEALRQALARGADRPLRVSIDGPALYDPIAVARCLAAAARAENPDLVICGVQSSDSAHQSTGPALASALGLPCVAVATKLELINENRTLVAHREFEGGFREIVEVDLPCLVTVQIGMNLPRYGSFKGMMKAKKTTIPVFDPGEAARSKVTVRRLFQPAEGGRKTPAMIDGGPAAVAERIIQLVGEART